MPHQEQYNPVTVPIEQLAKFNSFIDGALQPIIDVELVPVEQPANTLAAFDFESRLSKPTQPEYRVGRYEKLAPRFYDQAADSTRTNQISYLTGARSNYATDTNSRSFETMTEYDSLVRLRSFLEQAGDESSATFDYSKPQARSMLESLTFIGEREYQEAVSAIADKWKNDLAADPELQLCAIVGQIDETMVKSDAFLLDNILLEFSDAELHALQGRIVADPADLTADAEHIKVLLLDDWTISGSQMIDAFQNVVRERPQLKNVVELELIAASSDRLRTGLEILSTGDWGEPSTFIPVNAYFQAHDALTKDTRSNAHITGYHCSVDYDFNDEIQPMAVAMDIDMPPATNIVRPYRQSGVRLDQHMRLQSQQGAYE